MLQILMVRVAEHPYIAQHLWQLEKSIVQKNTKSISIRAAFVAVIITSFICFFCWQNSPSAVLDEDFQTRVGLSSIPGKDLTRNIYIRQHFRLFNRSKSSYFLRSLDWGLTLHYIASRGEVQWIQLSTQGRLPKPHYVVGTFRTKRGIGLDSNSFDVWLRYGFPDLVQQQGKGLKVWTYNFSKHRLSFVFDKTGRVTEMVAAQNQPRTTQSYNY